jgi:hypothetical protein
MLSFWFRDRMYSMTKLWIDDLRLPPSAGWVWIKTSQEAMDFLLTADIEELEEISFDHDLGEDKFGVSDTSRRVGYFLCEVNRFPQKVYVHSSNPVGVQYLKGMFDRYGNGAEIRQYVPPTS